MSGMAGQPWLVVVGSWKSPVVEILTFQAVHFRTALGMERDFSISEMIFSPCPGCDLSGLCPLAIPPSSCWCPAISSDSHPPFQKGDAADGLCSFSSAVDLQSRLQTALRAAMGSAGLDPVLWLRIQRRRRYPPSIPPFGSGLLNHINYNHFVPAQHWKYWQVEIGEEFEKTHVRYYW